jgi:hypothetical protein
MSECSRPGCLLPGKSSCAVCRREQYCSGSCQKGDWKIHKLICPFLKKLSNKSQPYLEVCRIIYEVLNAKSDDIRLLKHLMSYAEEQFGEQVIEIGHRENLNGDRIDNWNVDINVDIIFFYLNESLVNYYTSDNTLITLVKFDIMHPYLTQMLNLLNPCLIYCDSNASNRINNFNEDQKNCLLECLFRTEQTIASLYMNRGNHTIAEEHCQRCLAYARRCSSEGEMKIFNIFCALSTNSALQSLQGDCIGAVALAEEAYNLVVEAYDPVHPQVQTAAGILIRILIKKGDLSNLFDAERYAEVTYSNLRDKKNGMDQ